MTADVFQTQRALCALLQTSPEKVPDAITALYHAYWVEGQQITKPDVIEAVLGKAFSAEVAKSVMEGVRHIAAVQLSLCAGLITSGRADYQHGSEAAVDSKNRQGDRRWGFWPALVRWYVAHKSTRRHAKRKDS